MDFISLCVFCILLGQIRPGHGGGFLLDYRAEFEVPCYSETSSSLNFRTLPESGAWKFCLKTQVGTGFTGSTSRGIKSVSRTSSSPIGDCANRCTSSPGCTTFALNQYGQCFTTRWCPGSFDLNYSVYEMDNVTERCSPVEYLPDPTPSLGFN